MTSSLRYPDFLCIGAQKAGTTWLHRNLCDHPQLWLPPIKEVHYFDHVWNVRRERPYRHIQWWLRRPVGVIRNIRRNGWPNAERAGWHWRYVSSYGDRWYGSLFPTDPSLVVGEVAPTYARLDEDGVAHVARLIGRGKIIYILRNPIERSWSAASMHIRIVHGRDLNEASDSQIRYILDHPSTRQSADYVRHIELWRRYMGDANVLIAYYDDLCTDPRSFLQVVLRFLQVKSADEFIPVTANSHIGQRNRAQITSPYLAHLCNLHRDQIRAINEYLSNEHTEKWMDLANRHTAA